MKSTTKKAPAKSEKVFSDDELEAMQAAKIERKKGKKADLEARPPRQDQGAEGARPRARGKAPRDRQGGRPQPQTQDLVRHARLGRRGRQGRLLLHPGGKFKSRYASFGFNEAAKLDDGNMWPTSFALTKIGDAEEKKIAALVKKAVG